MWVIYNCRGERVGSYATWRGLRIAEGKLNRKLWSTYDDWWASLPESEKATTRRGVYRVEAEPRDVK